MFNCAKCPQDTDNPRQQALRFRSNLMRPKKCRLVRDSPSVRFFKPRAIPLSELEIVTLKDEEWEAIRLIDYEKRDQEAAAQIMGVSRPTFSRVLSSARATVAKALAEGCALAIGGGDFELKCSGTVRAKASALLEKS